MKTLLLLRHAKSSWNDPGLSDHDRPLKKRGNRDATRMGRLLRDEDLLPDLILCSTATRARETASGVLESSGYEGDVQFRKDLYDAGMSQYFEVLSKVSYEMSQILVIGHNPTLEELVYFLTGRRERMPTAALAQLTLNLSRWHELPGDAKADLVNLWRPRELE